MPFRRIWTEEEDKVLKYLRQDLKIHKWSLISQKLEHDFGINGRNQKQCRQRYHNHLNSSLKLGKLTEEEEKQLLNLHNRFGNRWAEIVKHFQGRTDASLKNLFHSKLRKAIRKFNRFGKQKCYGTFRPYPLNLVRKIMEHYEPNFIGQSSESSQRSKLLRELQNCLIQYSGSAVQSPMFEDWSEKKKFEHIRCLLDKALLLQFQDIQSETDSMSEQSEYIPIKSKENSETKRSKSEIYNKGKVALFKSTKERFSSEEEIGYPLTRFQQGSTINNLVILRMESSTEAQPTQRLLLQNQHKKYSFQTDSAEAQELSNKDSINKILEEINLLWQESQSSFATEKNQILDWDTILIQTQLTEELFEQMIEKDFPDPILF